ncbi:class D sortase [Bacillus massiliigorillae]|uniref:class D sortase n=1 Tax=Bacillus massiliigorillae TaxID=1243664 RepID=UPI0003A71696|nr:class D sortase [Bacillus massiliigorillae]
MKPTKPRKQKKWILLICALLLLIGGAYFTTTNAYKLLVGYTMYKWNKVVVKEDTTEPSSKPVSTVNKKQANTVRYKQTPKVGELMGELYIPKLDKTLPIIHGTDEDELAKGVGHFAGSVLPGERDNSVLSGHRDTVFRHLGEIGVGDELVTTTTAGTFTFKVKKTRIVDSDDRTVIVPKTKPTLTVTTCYPFNFIGDAPERYILVAELVKKDLNTVFVASK